MKYIVKMLTAAAMLLIASAATAQVGHRWNQPDWPDFIEASMKKKQAGIKTVERLRDHWRSRSGVEARACASSYDFVALRRKAELGELELWRTSISLSQNRRDQIMIDVAPIPEFNQMDAQTQSSYLATWKDCPVPEQAAQR